MRLNERRTGIREEVQITIFKLYFYILYMERKRAALHVYLPSFLAQL